MANHEINEEQEAVNKALRMIETSDPVHADVYNALFSILINNDVFLEKLANKMVQQVMISHVMDSTNPDMVMGADQGPVITKLIDKVQEQVTVLNTKAAVERPYAKGMIPETVGGFNYYGFIVSNKGWNYGNPSGDNYYIGIDENGYLYSGLQVNNHSEIIWRKFTGTLI